MNAQGRLLGVVLCGGRSSRMGRDKAALPHPSGHTFLQYAIGRLTPLCNEVAVSGSTGAEHQQRIIKDPIAHRGPAIGIAAALQFARQHLFDACFVTPVDMPSLTVDDLARLGDQWRTDAAFCCAITTDDGRLQPLVAIYPVELTASVELLANSEDRSLSRWIAQQERFKTIPLSIDSCRNVNTPDDLRC